MSWELSVLAQAPRPPMPPTLHPAPWATILAPALSVPLLEALLAVDRTLANQQVRLLAEWLLWLPRSPRLRAVIHYVASSQELHEDLQAWAHRLLCSSPDASDWHQDATTASLEKAHVAAFRVAMLRYLPRQAIMATGPEIFAETVELLPPVLRDSFLVDTIALATECLQSVPLEDIEALPLQQAKRMAQQARARMAPRGLS